jgi:hypothetical protein
MIGRLEFIDKIKDESKKMETMVTAHEKAMFVRTNSHAVIHSISLKGASHSQQFNANFDHQSHAGNTANMAAFHSSTRSKRSMICPQRHLVQSILPDPSKSRTFPPTILCRFHPSSQSAPSRQESPPRTLQAIPQPIAQLRLPKLRQIIHALLGQIDALQRDDVLRGRLAHALRDDQRVGLEDDAVVDDLVDREGHEVVVVDYRAFVDGLSWWGVSETAICLRYRDGGVRGGRARRDGRVKGDELT